MSTATAEPLVVAPPEPKTLPPGKIPSVLEAARAVKPPKPSETPKEDATRLFGGKAAKPAEKKDETKPETPASTTKADEKAAADKAAADKTAEAEKAEADKPVKAKTKKAEPVGVTEERIAEIAARTTAHMQKPATSASAAPAELPAALKAELPRLQKLEELFPDKYPKGTAQKQVDFELKAIEYERDWRKKNGNAKFDPDADEHDAFYDGQPEIDDKDLEMAREAIIEDRAEKRAMDKLAPQLSELKREQLRVKIAPEIRVAQSLVTSSILMKLNPELKVASNEALAKWQTENPKQVEIAAPIEAMAHTAIEAFRLIVGGAVDYDSKNPAHAAAEKLAVAFETEWSELPEDKQVDAYGRRWLPLAEWNKLPKEDQPKYCTTDTLKVAEYTAKLAAGMVHEIVEKQEKQWEDEAKRRGYTKLGVPETLREAPKNGEAKQQESPTPAARQLPSPSIGSGSPLSPSSGIVKTKDDSPQNPVLRLFGRG